MKPTRKRLREWTDQEIVQALSHGDQSVFAELFDAYSGAVFRYAWGLADRRSEVDDLVQETFLTAWRRRSSIRIVGDSALPWLLVTCRNVAMNANRRSRSIREDELVEESLDDPALAKQRDQHLAIEQLVWVREEIARLPLGDRKLCELCLIDGHSYESAADLLGLSVSAARKRMQRTRKQLRASRAAME